MTELDILNIDTRIHQSFQLQVDKLHIYKANLLEINKSLEIDNLRHRVKNTLYVAKLELEEHIYDIENKVTLNFYTIESVKLLIEFKSILNVPMKMSFMGKPIKNDKIKKKLTSEYLDIAKKYLDIDLGVRDNNTKIICNNCSNKKHFDIVDRNIYICSECYSQQQVIKHNSSYNDIDRVNISSKYMYDRKVHFRDCINQYQGKQNSTINQSIYDDLETQFGLHHLLVDSTDKYKKFSGISKQHVLMFLKDLGFTKHYENVHLIHYSLTGIKPDDISHLEDKLLNDFDSLTYLYDKMFKHINRKNFINTQYVLYQLLTRHKHQCEKEDFTILKTVDRKSFHDDICRVLFEHLGWNHTPYY
jgi:hypothetical protein